MNAVVIAGQIIKFLKENKGSGNTTTILDGAVTTGANVVMATAEDTQRSYRGVKPGKVVSLEQVQKGVLDEANKVGFPLVLDNGALVALLEALTPKPKKVKKSKDVG